jgi:hypothetical protein
MAPLKFKAHMQSQAVRSTDRAEVLRADRWSEWMRGDRRLASKDATGVAGGPGSRRRGFEAAWKRSGIRINWRDDGTAQGSPLMDKDFQQDET